MPVAYFIRRRGDVCAVIKLYADNGEEVMQEGLSLIEAENLYLAKIASLPRPAPGAAAHDDTATTEPRSSSTKNRQPKQLALKL
jgi:hypothetical protein